MDVKKRYNSINIAWKIYMCAKDFLVGSKTFT